jgi:mono/diheme cytochrome c family protein
MRPNNLRALGMLILTGLAAAAPLHGQVRPAPAPLAAPEPLTGSISFDLYCASCHGRSGQGNGPAASSLRTAPADLTLLARRNGGTFPRERVAATIDGSSGSATHGSPDMPVWGPTLRALEPDGRDAVRLRNLVAFVESIQRPAAAAAGVAVDQDGAGLYRDYCASCHGLTALGNGPFTFALRIVPPNLTTLAQRNGGSFPRDKVRSVVEGVGLRSHGDREMPVYGSLFRRLRPRDSAAAARIDAVVTFLESIQAGAPARRRER